MSTGLGMAGAICGLNFILNGSGATMGQPAPKAYFAYGRGDEGRQEWLESKTTWLKAPYVDPSAEGGDDY